ncbi:hypothetical protein EB822_10055 [Flavobacteriaceae bacterium PRS1]|nr:hypothetical protein EB822_10055 [Flavobacteriaceae bacterium PRS1]
MWFLFFILVIIFSNDAFSQSNQSVYPKNNQHLEDTNIVFIWNEDLIDSFYKFQIATDSLFQSLLIDSNNIVSNKINLSLSTYYFHVRSYSKNQLSNWSISCKFYCFIPSQLDSLEIWLSSDKGVVLDTNLRVQKWLNRVGRNNAVSPILINNPLFDTAEHSLYFDGQNRFLVLDSNVSAHANIPTNTVLKKYTLDE